MAEKGFLTLMLRDYDGEASNVSVHTTALTSGNWTAQSIARGLFISAIQGISKGLRVQQQFGNKNLENVGAAAAQDSQRELKWLVKFHDGTTLRRFTVEIPCANTALIDPDARWKAHIGDGGAVDFFVSQFQAYVLTPDGHAPIIDQIDLVGRRV